MTPNLFLDAYINAFISVFRRYVDTPYEISITGLYRFATRYESEVSNLIERLRKESISIILIDGADSVSAFEVSCKNLLDSSLLTTTYQLQGLPAIIDESSKTGLPVVCLIIMKCIARVLCGFKILYKAIVLDLDDTLWDGTLSEIGIEQISKNLSSEGGAPFISFMHYVKILAEELGIFVAICSRNDTEQVTTAIEQLDESIFPLKHQIDCIVANDNDKSDNLNLIAKQLSILPDAIVFVDDNKLVRDEVRMRLPGIFVPEWNTHSELVSILLSSCCFERNELSIKSQQRRKQYSIILFEKRKSSRPILPILVVEDRGHKNATELYAKSNQFNFSQHNQGFPEDAKSIYFELLRDNGESLGVCSTLTYTLSDETCLILNWAMSCRFFEIGVEEYVLLYVRKLAGLRKTVIRFKDSGLNLKAMELLNRYVDQFVKTDQETELEVAFTPEWEELLQEQTNLHND